MKHRIPALAFALAFAFALSAAPAAAACFADYKAKRDGPLQLHYGVAELSDADCSRRDAERVIARRIARDGWQLLAVMSVFDEDGLDQRRDSAGDYFLRY